MLKSEKSLEFSLEEYLIFFSVSCIFNYVSYTYKKYVVKSLR